MMQETHRQLLGENLVGLPMSSLQKIESQLEVGVNRVRARKTQLLLDQIQDLRKKEDFLLQENQVLRNKLADAKNTFMKMNSQDIPDCSSVKASSLQPTSIRQNESSGGTTQTTLQLGLKLHSV